MRTLFIHSSFPGPFASLASSLGSEVGNTVLFLSERMRREVRLPRVRRLLIPAVTPEEGQDSAQRESQLLLRRGAHVANVLLRLRNQGFYPDMVCSSSGGGYSLYVADIFPKAFQAVYADWFYRPNSDLFPILDENISPPPAQGSAPTLGQSQHKAANPANFAPLRIRNLSQYNALGESAFSFTATRWQQAQFPSHLAERMHIFPHGVDVDFFSPVPEHEEWHFPVALDSSSASNLKKVTELLDPSRASGLKKGVEVVTFSGRSLEAHQGFQQFALALPQLLQNRPNCHVLIMAAERHQALAPEALAFLSPQQRARVHFLGFLTYANYRDILRLGTVHVYFTAPYALSAGLYEAMSCGCLVLGSDTAPAQEVIHHAENGFLCDFSDPQNLAETLAAILDRAPRLTPLREAARQNMVAHYNSHLLGPQHKEILLQAWQS